MGWHNLKGAYPGSVRNSDGTVGAYLSAVEALRARNRVEVGK
jgi:hypothetical protein